MIFVALEQSVFQTLILIRKDLVSSEQYRKFNWNPLGSNVLF
jgi:hypothetical protein